MELDERFQISFCTNRKYREGEAWLIPYRGAKEEDMNWLLPTGQHYFAHVFPVSTDSLPHNSALEKLASDTALAKREPGIGHLIERLIGSTAHLRRSLAAKVLASETTHMWLKNWLGTALMSELLNGDFNSFWQRMTKSLPLGMAPDKDLHYEARKIWTIARSLDLALQEHALTNRINTMV
jgi:hypothetical protein